MPRANARLQKLEEREGARLREGESVEIVITHTIVEPDGSVTMPEITRRIVLAAA